MCERAMMSVCERVCGGGVCGGLGVRVCVSVCEGAMMSVCERVCVEVYMVVWVGVGCVWNDREIYNN